MQKTDIPCGHVLSCGQTRSTKLRNSLLAVLALTVLLTPPYARAVQREAAMLFFSFADLTQMLSHPILPSLAARSSNRTWQEQYTAAKPVGPLERRAHWGNGLGFDGYADAGPRWSLWRF